VTLAQDDLPRDPSILRAIAEQNMFDLGDFGNLPCAGVYAEVIKTGHIQCGDTLRFVE
jgi:MOSC domain-containing protein YiiM